MLEPIKVAARFTFEVASSRSDLDTSASLLLDVNSNSSLETKRISEHDHHSIAIDLRFVSVFG